MKIIITILLFLALLAPALAQEEGLVAEWHFDEGAGNVLHDSTGNGNDGTIYGATWVDGKFGKALSFDGVDDYAGWQNIPIGQSMTILVTAKSSTTVWNTNGWVASARGPNGFIIHPDHGGKTWKGYIVDSNAKYQMIGSHTPDDITQWHQYGVMYDYGSQIGYMIFDGHIVATKSLNVIRSSATNIDFGRDQYGNRYGIGFIDEVRIYNRALTAEEIKSNYEQEPAGLSITKSVSPQSIKQGQTASITLTVKNTGSTEIRDIEIADTVPSYLTFIDGETSKIYESLAPKESRQISYTLKFNSAGTFNFEPAIATYADDKGNYNTVESKPASIEVIRSIVEKSAQAPKPTNSNAQSASVNLHGEKTDVALGEDVLLKLSAVNIIGNPAMHVQVIIIPPSGWSVTSSEFAKSGAGQYTTTYELEAGGGKDIEVRIVPNQIGDDFQVEGRIIYYFGDDVGTREDHTLSLPITVRAASNQNKTTGEIQSGEESTPWYTLVAGLLGLVALALFIKKNSGGLNESN